MRYLTLAFAGEGPTDHAFISSLIARYTEELLIDLSDEKVEVGPVISVLPDHRYTNQADVVAAEFLEGEVFADVLFLHTDAGSSADRAYAERVVPVRDALGQLEASPYVVGVVPDRETEAWMLADARAVERVLGVRNGLLHAPQPPSRLHRILDPKAGLIQLLTDVDSAVSRRARSRRHVKRVERVYSGLAAEIDFTQLMRVPSFQTFDHELREALQQIGLINV